MNTFSFDDGFISMPIKTWSEIEGCRGGTGGLFWPSENTGIKFDTGNIMAYGFRRFGYPTTGWDDYKQLCEWVVTTPMDGVFLTITPRRVSPFGYLLRRDIENNLIKERTIETEIDQALQRAIYDLKRPVSIRDWQINIEGECSEEDFDFDAPVFSLAGYPVDLDTVGNDDYLALRKILRDRYGSTREGFRQLVEYLRVN